MDTLSLPRAVPETVRKRQALRRQGQLGAYGHVRVSTEEQSEAGNSLPAQRRRIEARARQDGYQILRWFEEVGSAYQDADRRSTFMACLSAALQDPACHAIYYDDSSRWSRDRYISALAKKALRDAGIEIRYAQDLTPDTRTSAGVWLDAIQDAKNQVYSMEVSFHVRKAMSENIAQRDPETGWCYKNGGRAPFGYRIVKVQRGTKRNGEPRFRSLWEIDEREARVIQYAVRELTIAQQMPLDRQRRHLNEKGPDWWHRSGPWGKGTYWEMFREERLLELAGYAYWNKEYGRKDRRTMGRFRPQEEWIWVPNAHPAIITEEEARMARAIIGEMATPMRGRPKDTAVRAEGSRWLLSGVNLIGEPMFVCLCCGQRMSGNAQGGRHRDRYVCACHRYYDGLIPGGDGRRCKYAPVDKAWIETAVWDETERRYGNPEMLRESLRKQEELARTARREAAAARGEIERELRQVEKEIENLVAALARGIDPDILQPQIAARKTRHQELEARLKIILEEPLPPEPDYDRIAQLVEDLRRARALGDGPEANRAKRRAIRWFLRQVQLDPHAGEVHLVWWPEPQETTLQTRNTASLQAGGGVRTTGGVGGGTQAVVRTILALPVRLFRAKSPFQAE